MSIAIDLSSILELSRIMGSGTLQDFDYWTTHWQMAGNSYVLQL